jgi:YhcH/YjgK/YiaL family protein
MIIDKIENASKYLNINKNLNKALEKMKKEDFSKIEEGRYEIDGEKIFMLVQNYNTKDEKYSRWESHFKYMDIQYVFKGTEIIKYAHVNELRTMEHDSNKDICFWEGEGDSLTLTSGTFAIFMPDDAHKPGISSKSGANSVKKIVFKVLL